LRGQPLRGLSVSQAQQNQKASVPNDVPNEAASAVLKIILVCNVRFRAAGTVSRAQRLRREYENVAEELLGQIPMLSGGPAGDIGGIEERGNQYPGIVEHLLGRQRVERNGRVEAGSDALQPALRMPAG